jgi:hypothetical protein
MGLPLSTCHGVLHLNLSLILKAKQLERRTVQTPRPGSYLPRNNYNYLGVSLMIVPSTPKFVQ